MTQHFDYIIAAPCNNIPPYALPNGTEDFFGDPQYRIPCEITTDHAVSSYGEVVLKIGETTYGMYDVHTGLTDGGVSVPAYRFVDQALYDYVIVGEIRATLIKRYPALFGRNKIAPGFDPHGVMTASPDAELHSTTRPAKP